MSVTDTVPKLRFPEFEGEWGRYTVDDVLRREGDPVEVKSDELYRQIGVRSHGRGLFHKDAVTGADLGGKRVFHVVPNSFVVNIVFAWEQAVALITDAEKGFIASHRFPMYLEKDELSFLPYIREMFLRKRGKQLLELASPGGAGRNKTLGQQEFLKLKVILPKREEQKKIAAFLGVVDAKIAALRARRAGLERYKRGLMQALFSQTLRFTKLDGTAFPDWEEKRLGELGATYGGLSGKSGDDFGEGKPFITYKQVFGSSGIDVRECAKVRLGAAERQNRVKAGDILFTTSSETPNEVGFASVLVEDAGELYLNSFCFGLRPNSLTNLKPEFSKHLFRSAEYRRAVFPLAQGSTRYNLAKSSFVKLRLVIPHPDEQAKIADALSAMDAKIAAVGDQVTQMEAFKKGLLQQMFV